MRRKVVVLAAAVGAFVVAFEKWGWWAILWTSLFVAVVLLIGTVLVLAAALQEEREKGRYR